jgi:PGF-CTERM protein
VRYNKFLLCTIILFCLAFQAYAQSDPLGEGASSTMGSSGDYLNPNTGQAASSANPDEGLRGMSQWLDQPVPKDVTKSTTTATSTTPGPDATKSTATTTSSTPATEPTSTSKSTTATSTTPGFEATFALTGILAVAFLALRRRS